MPFYADCVLPFCTNLICGSPSIAEQRAKVVPCAQGVVVEIGFGSGHNLKYYSSTEVERIIGIEPSLAMQNYAEERIREAGIAVELLACSAEEIPLPSQSADCVVSTYTLCTIPQVERALSEIYRILKPGGQFLFSEHGISARAEIRKWQQRIEPVWKRIAGGCHLTRNIPQLIERANFHLTNTQEGSLPNSPAIAGYNYWGSVTRH